MVIQPVNILMIEDNPGDALLVEEYLADPGRGRYAIAHRDRLSGALAYLSESRCDLILLDLTLPDSSGLKTFATIHDQVGDIPIVILTGHDDDLLAAQAIQDGAKDFIPKSSLDGALLTRTIRHAMERRSWEERLHQSGMRASRLEKFEAAGMLGAGIAHHFNNLLTTIIGNCELIADHPGLDAAVRERNGVILKTAHRAVAVTRSLATFCRTQPAEPSLFRLDELVHGLAPLLGSGAAGNIALAIEADPSAGFISGDPSEIEQAVLNLAQNAREAMPDGGTLAIRTFPVVLPVPAEGAPDRVPAGEYAALVVADAGCGMAPEVAVRAFDPFFTTKGQLGGQGLGLATVASIVCRHGGFIQVASEPGAGATFTVYLPRHEPPGEVVLPASASAPDLDLPCRGTETILLVEDDADLNALFSEALRGCGYQVLSASDGEAAVGLFARHAEAIDLVISDLTLPRLDGPELFRRLRAMDPGVRIVVMTGHAEGLPEEPGGRTREAARLIKPFNPRLLARTVRDVLDGADGG